MGIGVVPVNFKVLDGFKGVLDALVEVAGFPVALCVLPELVESLDVLAFVVLS